MEILKTTAHYGGTAAISLAMGIAVPFIAGWEGKSNVAYLDLAKVWTVCYGETRGVNQNTIKSDTQCAEMLDARTLEFMGQVDALVKPDLKPNQMAALTSFAYNVGMGSFAGSNLLKRVNKGDIVGACTYELPRWVFIGKKPSRGLMNRRNAEKKLCLS